MRPVTRWGLLDTLCSLHFLARTIDSATNHIYYYATNMIMDKQIVRQRHLVMTVNASGGSYISAKGELVGAGKGSKWGAGALHDASEH